MMEKKNSLIKTAVIEKRREWREKFVSLINVTPGFKCFGTYETPKKALNELSEKMPDIVLCNFHSTDAGEKKFVRALRSKFPKLLILTLSFHDTDEFLLDAPKNASGDCLLKITMPSELIKKSPSACPETMPIFDAFMMNIMRLLHGFLPSKDAEYKLTPHEKRLLELLIEGHNQTTAARVLNVSYNTVKFHMRRIYQKLEVNSKSAAVAKALRYQLI